MEYNKRMLTFIGLGNPEQKYLFTRHNAGWQFLDFVAKEHDFPEFQEQKKFNSLVSRKNDMWLLKPLTYMNDSGKAVRAFLQFYQPELFDLPQLELKDLVVVHDDLDIPIGGWKLQFGSGPKVHNGINSIRDHLHTDQFWYGRIGVDGREGNRNESGKEYVLQPFLIEEKKLMQKSFEELKEQLTRTFNI